MRKANILITCDSCQIGVKDPPAVYEAHRVTNLMGTAIGFFDLCTECQNKLITGMTLRIDVWPMSQYVNIQK